MYKAKKFFYSVFLLYICEYCLHSPRNLRVSFEVAYVQYYWYYNNLL